MILKKKTFEGETIQKNQKTVWVVQKVELPNLEISGRVWSGRVYAMRILLNGSEVVPLSTAAWG